MIYKSNLPAPHWTQHFKHLTVRPMGHSFGHSVPSDWADKADDDPQFGLYKRCGLWTHDEAAILYWVAKHVGGDWVDIGAHTGWTTAHIASGSGREVDAVDPMFGVRDFVERFMENTGQRINTTWPQTSNAFFAAFGNTKAAREMEWAGVCIDGDHEPGKPLEDAKNAAAHLTQSGVIVFHDFTGQPVREAVQYLMDLGFSARVYFTPHGVACCWRGSLVLPDHAPDPAIERAFRDGRFSDFDFERCV